MAAVLSLIELIYDTALGAQDWPCLLKAIASSVNGHSAMLRRIDYTERQVSFFETAGYEEHYKRAYREHFIRLDNYRPILETMPTGSIVSTTPVLPLAERRKTEYFNDYELPQDKIYVCGGTLARAGTAQLQLGVHRGMAAGDFEPNDLAHLDRLVPHLVRAIHVRQLVGEATFRQGLAEAAFDRLRVGVILTDGAGKPLYLNREAETLVAATGGLTVRPDGLAMRNPADTARLRQLIATAALTAAGKGEKGAGGALRLDTGHESLHFHIVPLAAKRMPMDSFAPAACAAVFVSRPGPLRLPWRRAAAHYGLTQAEAKLAVALADGESLEVAAETLGITVNTARYQLKAVFAKTGARRQPELVAMLLKGVIACCRSEEEPP